MDDGTDVAADSVWAIVVAAGSGSRFGGAKQYEPLGGRRVLDWSLDAARSHAGGVVLVVSEGAPMDETADRVVIGGATRSESVRAGLQAVPEDVGYVLVHDAARPLATAGLFRSVIDALANGADVAVPGLTPVDTMRASTGGTVDRSELVAVQTPQGFRAPGLRAAHASSGEATDDAGLVEAVGGSIVVVDGEPANRKITTPDDLVVAEALLSHRQEPC